MEFFRQISQGNVVAFAVVIAFIALLGIIAHSYGKVPPNRVAVIYGRVHKTKDGRDVGFRVVTGGTYLRVPLMEDVAYLDLDVVLIDLNVTAALDKDGAQMDVKGVCNVKVLSDEVSVMAACEHFLGKRPEQIKEIAYEKIEGHLRAIIGRLTVEEIVEDRAKFSQAVSHEAAEGLREIGMGIDLLTVQGIKVVGSLGSQVVVERA